jgi:hypothetical protein
MVPTFESEPVPIEISANALFFAMRTGFYGPMLKRNISATKPRQGNCRKHEAKIKTRSSSPPTRAHLALCAAIFLRAVYRESPFSEEISSATNPVKKPARDINKNQLS